MCLAFAFKSNFLLFTFANLESISHWAASIHFFYHSPHFPFCQVSFQTTVPDEDTLGLIITHIFPWLALPHLGVYGHATTIALFCRGNNIFVLTIFHRTPCNQLNMFKAVFGRNRKEEKRSRRDPGRKENKHHQQHCTHYSLGQVTRHLFTHYNSVTWFCW